jgi:hypothetical protein
MSRKRCYRRPVAALPPRGLRPRLDAGQLRDLALCHVVNLDAIATGTAPPAILWDIVGGSLMWHRTAVMLGTGVPEMALQLEVATRLVERYARTGVVRFDGPDYQLAKIGLQVMDELATLVDRPTAVAAADWSELEVMRIAAAADAQRAEHHRAAA